MTRDPDTEELPAGGGRDPTLPLPRQEDDQPPPRARRRLTDVVRSSRPWVAVAAAAALAAGSFALGWAVAEGPGEDRRPAVQASQAAPLPPNPDALYCGRALDLAAEVIDAYRNAMENRIAFIDAALDDDTLAMSNLDAELQVQRRRVERLGPRVTRALAVCPS